MCREARFGVAVGVREHHLFEKKKENKIATTKSLILAQDER